MWKGLAAGVIDRMDTERYASINTLRTQSWGMNRVSPNLKVTEHREP